MLKIACVLSNRATYYRQKKLFLEMQKDKNIELTLLLTSSLLEKEHANTFTEIDMLFNYRMVSMGSYGGSLNDMAHAASRLSLKFTSILSEGRFDCAMVCADRWELLPFGMAASYIGLPLIHIQGGEVSGNIDDKVRNALSMLSDLHFVSHKHAEERLKGFGLENIHCTGCPSISLLREAVSNRMITEAGHVIGMFHPHTKEIHEAATQSALVLYMVKEYCQKNNRKLYFFGSNNDPGYNKIVKCLDVDFIYDMSGEDFYRLLAGAHMIVGNSSCGIREASYLGIPSVNIGDRQEGRVKGDNVIDCGFHEILSSMEKAGTMQVDQSFLFGDGESVPRMIKIIKEEYCGKS